MRKAALTEAQIRKHLADNLSYLRQAKTPKLSQKAVARILNLPPKTIMNYDGLCRPSPCCVLRLHDGGTADKKSKKRKEEYHVNHSQRNLKKLIRAKEDSIADEELFLSAAYQKYQTSLA